MSETGKADFEGRATALRVKASKAEDRKSAMRKPVWAFMAIDDYIADLQAVSRAALALVEYSDVVPLPLPDANYAEKWDHLCEAIAATDEERSVV